MATAKYDRVALIIGNSAYGDGIGLDKPVADAGLITERVKKLAFNVVGGSNGGSGSGCNLDHDALFKLCGEFLGSLKPGGVALIYYAGHGVQINRTNYMVPIGATLTAAEIDKDLVDFGAIVNQAARIVGDRGADGHVIALLDACRDAPFSEQELRIAAERSRAQNEDGANKAVAAGGRGLSMHGLMAKSTVPAGASAAGGSAARLAQSARVFVGFATAPGEVAFDTGEAANSPFAKALSDHLCTRALEFNEVYNRVKIDVKSQMERRGHYQDPWSETNFDQNFFLNPQSWQPVGAMGALGLVAGIVICWALLSGGRLSDSFLHPWMWGLGLLLSAMLGFGTWKWGSGKAAHIALAIVGPALAFVIALAILQLAPRGLKPGLTEVFVSSPTRTQALELFTWLMPLVGFFILGGSLWSRKPHRNNPLGWISFGIDVGVPILLAMALFSMGKLLSIDNPYVMVLSVLALLAGIVIAAGMALSCRPQHSVFRGFGAITGAITTGILAAILFLLAVKFGQGWDRHDRVLLLIAMGTAWFGLLGAQLGYCFAYYVPEHGSEGG